MGVSINCDGCGKSDPDEIYCSVCSAPSADSDVADYIEDLSAAIRRGDRDEAELLLDRLASENEGWSEYVSRGRYGWKAKRPA